MGSETTTSNVYRLPIAPLRPVTRGDCLPGGRNAARPCRFSDCRYALDASGGESCTLDVAARGGETLDAVGKIFGVTRERIRQMETVALAKDLRQLAGG